MPFRSTKTYGHECGLSVAFRQHRADSHCRFVHGYAIAVELVFEAYELNSRNWVMDFGALSEVKKMLQNRFDHKTLVAQDDPFLEAFKNLAADGVVDLIVVPKTGCEAFAEQIFYNVSLWLVDNDYAPRVQIISATVREHGANSATYTVK